MKEQQDAAQKAEAREDTQKKEANDKKKTKQKDTDIYESAQQAV